jgi:hypothetical protein
MLPDDWVETEFPGKCEALAFNLQMRSSDRKYFLV